MAELKQSRWVKIHEPGQANFDEQENVMDIRLGANRLMAEATYTVRSHKKAAYWLSEYLRAADALQVVAKEILEQINTAAENADRDEDVITVDGEGWSCEIEKMDKGVFKVQMNWSVDEEVTKKVKEPKKKPAGKKRGRPKKEAKDNAPDTES